MCVSKCLLARNNNDLAPQKYKIRKKIFREAGTFLCRFAPALKFVKIIEFFLPYSAPSAVVNRNVIPCKGPFSKKHGWILRKVGRNCLF